MLNKTAKILIVILIVIAVAGAMIWRFLQIRETEARISVVTTNFPTYDFARVLTKDVPDVEIKMLIPPGAETHGFDPSPRDIITVSESNLYIYDGQDKWQKDLYESAHKNADDSLDIIKIVIPDGKAEIDEHVWLNPESAMKIVSAMNVSLQKIDPGHSEQYNTNYTKYVNDLAKLDKQIETIIDASPTDTIVVADRFPLKHFTDHYELEYISALPNCDEETEASSADIAGLIEYIKEHGSSAIIKLVLSDNKIAETVAKETGAEIVKFYDLHNIPKEDFDNGLTYLDAMNSNKTALKEALLINPNE